MNQLEVRLRRKIRAHVRGIGFSVDSDWKLQSNDETKETVRKLHARQKKDRISLARSFLDRRLTCALTSFASGEEITPDQIKPRLELVKSGTPECDLFRIASLTWSVPVSQGFGRRMRFLVWDESNHKVMGIIALGDPVFNLGVRDRLIGWTTDGRCSRLVNVMDAYVLGAVPPYSFILAGKLVACLLRTIEMRDAFHEKYSNSRGVISGEKKCATLALITTTSALGRSSIYNRLKLDGTQYLEQIGFTEGYGHFHVDGDLFDDVRQYLRRHRHSYAKDYKFGRGPNWKFRAIRAAFDLLNIDRSILRHGLKREVFACQVAKNAIEVLREQHVNPDYSDLLSVSQVSKLAIDRWISPRSARRQEFLKWKKENLTDLLFGATSC